MLMNQAMGQMMNPYGLSPQGAQNFGGFNQGSRQFNPYGAGYGPGGATGTVGGAMGGGQGMGGMMPGSSGGGIPPNIMQLLSQLLGGGGAGGPAITGGRMPGLGGAPTGMAPAPRQLPLIQRMQTGMAQSPINQTTPNQPRAIMPVNQQMGGYDGTTVGYGGRPAGGFTGGGARFPTHAAPNVMALMRALGQVPRPRMMAAPPMGAMRMPGR